jgi:AraC family transcriptional regulator
MSMAIYDALLKGLCFIEDNLCKPLGVLDVAKHVSFSQFYFSREFSRRVHISVYDYILRRKLSEAYRHLFESGGRIVDAAFKYGFSSHEVFSRAFRKMFGENPRDAVRYRPLAVFEPIDAPYLQFLYGLEARRLDEPEAGCFFEIEAGGEEAEEGCRLMLLRKEDYFECVGTFTGKLSPRGGPYLCFGLPPLKRVVRIHHTDETYAFRYILDNAFDAGALGGNYILLDKKRDHIDFLIPVKAE